MRVWRNVIWLSVVVLTLGATTWGQDGTTRYDGYQIVTLHLENWAQVDLMRALGGRCLADSEMIGDVSYMFAPQDLSALQASGLAYKVVNPDVQKGIDVERARIGAGNTIDDDGWFLDFKNLDQVNTKLNQLAAQRPDLASVFDIGLSYEGRHIYGIRISGPGTNKPAIEFDGCHHAREWISVMTPMWIAHRLVNDYDTDATVHALVDQLEWYIIPVANVDGYVYTWTTNRYWRKNRHPYGSCVGVDNNRNYGVGFGGPGSSGSPCSDGYRGPSAFSEPETQRIRDFFLAHPNIVASQSYHSYHLLVMSPYGWTSSLPAEPHRMCFTTLGQGQHDAVDAVHGVSYGYGPSYSTIYPAAGNTVDWAYDVAHSYAFTTELRGTDFVLPPDQIIPTGEENFAGALYLASWSASPVKIMLPDGPPSRLNPNVPLDINVQVLAVYATLDPNSPRLFARIGDSGNFTTYPLTSLGSSQYRATLPATPCGQTLYYYFSAATTDGIVGYSPADAPATTYSVAANPVMMIQNLSMDTDPEFTFSGGQWAWGHPTGHGGEWVDPSNGYTGSNVVGYNLNGNYPNNMPEYDATTPAINCFGRAGVHLSFWRWLGLEWSAFDHAAVKVSNDGTTWTTIWENPASSVIDCAWIRVDYDISAVADNQATVYIRWAMGPTDVGVTYCGWNIDDVTIWAVEPCSFPLGDLNCDGLVNNQDITGFIDALFGDATAYDAYLHSFPEYHPCSTLNADFSGDGLVNSQDIDGFINALFGG